MSNQFLKLRRSAVPGKIPETGSLDLGEIALNTHDGLAFMKKSVGGNESIVVIGNSTGSFTGSFSGEFTGSLLGTSSWAYNAVTASTADDFYARGNITGSNALFSGTVTAQRLVVQTVSSSVIYSSGSNIFGDELSDTQQFTGSVTITGSLTANGPSTFNGRVTANNLTGSLFGTSSWAVSSSYALAGNGTFTGSFTGSFFGNGAGLTNISASSVVGLNLSLISSGSVTASTDPTYGFKVNANSQFSGSSQITGSLGVTGSVSISGSLGSVFSANVDTMTFTGSLFQTGSTFLTGTLSVFGGITGSLFGTSSWAISASHAPTALTSSFAVSSSLAQTASLAILAPAYTTTASFNQFTGSYLINSASWNNSISSLSSSYTSFSSSYLINSASWNNNISLLSSSYTSFSSSYLINSASWNNNISLLSSSFLSTSQSLVNNIQLLSSSFTSFSSSYSIDSSSWNNNISLLSSSFLAFSQSYNTGSFTGSFNGQATLTGSFTGRFYGDLSGSFSGSVANIHGATNYIAKFDSPNGVDSSVIYQSASSIAINETSFTAANPEALYVFQTHPTSINVITGKGNRNNYLQLNIQNTNQGTDASSDIVATANNGDEFSNYIDMGINSENFNTGYIGEANDAYVYSIANNLHIGNAATNGSHLGFFVGGDDVQANNKLQLNPTGPHYMSGSLEITGSLNVLRGITGSLFGTSSWAVSASNAVVALSSSFAATASYIANVVYTTGSQTISGLKTFTDKTTFNNHVVLNGTGSNNYTLAFKQPSSTLSFLSGDYTEIGAFGSNVLDFNFGQLPSDYRRFAFNVGNLSLNTPRTFQFPDKSGTLLVDDIASGSVASASFAITASYAINTTNAVSASYAATASSADNFFVRQNITASNALIYGSLTAQTIYAQYITASTELITGSTKFGTQLTDTHQFTGSVTVTGSLSLNNDPVITQTPYNNFSQSIQFRATKLELTSSILTSASASFAQDSGSNSVRLTNLETTASVLTTASASFAIVSSSYASASGSLSIRVTDLESTASVLTQASASFAQQSGSNSIRFTNLETTASVLTTASASFALVSSSYSQFSQSYSTGSFTGSFTGYLFGTSSWAVSASHAPTSLTASYALTASHVNPLVQNVQITGSLNVSGSQTFIGTSTSIGIQTVTGSLVTSGSNTLVGNTYLTGSVNITGSTTHIGNNTLLGNTTLSGSVIISGSQGISTPTIKIFGDIEQTGYTRFLPVTTNINTSISASYIYVSGSTNDLYFSQNGRGYSNTTRLRWLEGNLYTGLLNGGLITTQSSTVYQISSGSGIIVNLNASLNDNPYPTIQYLNWNNLSASIAAFTASYQQAFVGIDSTNNIFAQGTPFSNGQFDTVINIGNVLFQNQSTINGVKTQPSVAYGFEQAQNTFNRAFGPLKLSGYTLAPSGSSTGSLVVGSGTAYAPGSNYAVDPNEPYYSVDNGTSTSKIFRYYQSGSTWVYLSNAGAGFATIDPANYSNNGTLTAVGAGNWSIQRVFWFPNSVTKAIVVYYGNQIYATEAEAVSNISFESFVEAPNTAANAIYLGAIVISGPGVFTNTNTYKILPGGLFRNVGGSGGGGSLVTQTLAGLSDVAISGPTNLQPLAYSTTVGKWINTSFLTASISGNAETATSASFATTASYILQAVSASFATTASYVLQAVSSSFATTASYVQNAESASYILQAVSASFATSASYSVSSSFAQTASFVQNAQSASYVLQAVSASFATSASFSTTASYVQNAQTASYVLNAISASYAATASSADDFLVRQSITASNALITGTLTAQTIIAQTITSSTDFVTGSTKFGSLLSNTHQFTGSVTITGSLSVNNSSVILSNQTSSMSVLSSSFALTASYAANVPATASYALQALSSSYSNTASFAITASYAESTSNVLGGINNYVPIWSGSSTLITSSLVQIISPSALNVNIGQDLNKNYNSLTLYGYTEPALYLSSSNNDYLSLYNSFGQVALSYFANPGTNNLIRYNGYTDKTLTLQTDFTDRLTINGSGSIKFNAYTTNGLLKTTGSNGSVVMATASVDYVIPSTLNNYVLNSQTSSMSVLSSSYALTASYALNAGGSGISAIYIADQGTLLGTASYFDFTGNVSASVSNGTASINIITQGGALFHTQSIAATTWSLNHNLNTYTPLIQVYDPIYRQLIPNEVIGVSPSLSEVRFDYAQAGYAIVSTGGSFTITGSTAQLYQSVPAVTWSFAHNLNTKYPVFQVYDDLGNVIIPSGIYAVDTKNAEIYFATPTDGVAVADFSGINGLQDNAVSASYAATASLLLGTVSSASYASTASTAVNFNIASTLTLDGTLTDYADVNSSVVGSNNLFTRATGSFTSAFFKYTVANGSNARTGEAMAIWNGNSVQYTDNSTLDIGSTSAVTSSVSVVSGDVQFNMQTNTSGWKIKSLATFM